MEYTCFRARLRTRVLSVLLVLVFFALHTSHAYAATIPFTSDGRFGVFNPVSDAVFYTDNGTFKIGSNLYSGARSVLMSVPEDPEGYVGSVSIWVFDFTTINIPSGVTVHGAGSLPLILLAQGDAIIEGTINISGEQGANGPGGGGGGGGGALAIFANTITVGLSGKILVRGGDGGLSDMSGTGKGGLPSPGGGAGGNGGGDVAGGAGGGGGTGGAVIGRGGGGGGGGAYAGPGGPGGASGFLVAIPASAGAAGAAGCCDNHVPGGVGGGGAGAGLVSGGGGAGGVPPGGAGAAGGNGILALGGGGGGGGGATCGGGGGPGGVGAGLGGGGGGGGGADTCGHGVGPGGGAGGGPGGGGGGAGGNGGSGQRLVAQKQGGAGGGGAIHLGAASDLVRNFGLISVTGGISEGQQGGLGVIGILGTLQNSGTIEGEIFESPGFSAEEWWIAGGGGGGGTGGDGKPYGFGRVGGITIPINKFELLALYIGLVSTILVTTTATAIYVKRVKRRKEKQ